MNEDCLRLENARILDVYGKNSRVGGRVSRGPGHCRSRRPDVVGLVLSAEAAPMHDATFNWSYARLTPEVTAAMKQLALEQRRLLGSRAPWHVGDLAWGLRQHEGREAEWTFRLWRNGDRAVAWSWLKSDGGLLDYDVHPEHRYLLDEILDEPEAKEAIALEDADEARERSPGTASRSWDERCISTTETFPSSHLRPCPAASATAQSSRTTSSSASRPIATSGSRAG